MPFRTHLRLSSQALRREVNGRGAARPGAGQREVSFGASSCVVYAPDEEGGGHGNFVPASFRRIAANPDWARRLGKAYTGSRHLPRAGDRRRGELECASSSDALLMNVFCYPGLLSRSAVRAVMGTERGGRPEFGVRADLPMRRGEIDRTELDMRIGSTLVEAKLTETGFGRASRERLLRYEGVEEVVAVDELPRSGAMFGGYQIVRGLLAALQSDGRYVVLLDERRSDLREVAFRVLSAVRWSEHRERMRVRTWQELAGALPPVVRRFLAERYGIEAVP